MGKLMEHYLWDNEMPKELLDQIDKNDPHSLQKLELKEVEELIEENKRLQGLYPPHIKGLLISLATLENMKKMLIEQINEE